MHSRFVYLIKSQNRLVTLSEEVEDDDFLFLYKNNSSHLEVSEALARAFCLGVLAVFEFPNCFKDKPINAQKEFQGKV